MASTTLDALTTFLQDRIREFDPTIDTEPGSDIYSAVISPLVARLGPFPEDGVSMEAFIRDRLSELHPDLDTSRGSGLTELLVHPMTSILEPFLVETQAAARRADLSDVDALSDDELDTVLSALLVFRQEGALASGVVRVFFSSPITVSVDPAVTFSSVSGLQFVTDEVRTFSPDEMRRSGQYYYIDVAARAAFAGREYEVAAGEIGRFDGIPGAVRVTNPFPFAGGAPRENNEDFLARAQRAIAERSPTTERGFESVILESLPGAIGSVSVVGYGDPEMERDVLQVGTTPAGEVGDLLTTVGQFEAEPVLGVSGGMFMPFTNRIRVLAPGAEDRAQILSAAYLSITEANGDFISAPLSVYRRVLGVVEDGLDLVVTVDDFTAYPSPPALGAAAAGAVDTSGDQYGFNANPAQGGSYDLAPMYDGFRRIAGAPTPMSDTCGISALAGAPGAVIGGRDFLVLAGNDATNDGLRDVPNAVRAWPIRQRLPSSIRVGRPCDRLERLGAVDYPGPDEYVYPAGDADGRVAARMFRVVAFGAPDYSASAAADRYAGNATSPWGRGPGVRLGLYDPGAWGTWSVKSFGSANIAEVSLSSTAAGWSTRGVRAGQHISLAVFTDEVVAVTGVAQFSGLLADVDSATGLQWYAWGRIVSVVDDHTLRVEGLDVTPLRLEADGGLPAGDVAGFDWPSGGPAGLRDYVFAWTVYESAIDVIDGRGEVIRSYAEHSHLPAYKSVPGAVAAPSVASYFFNTYNSTGDLTENEPLTALNHSAYWIRLSERVAALLDSRMRHISGRWFVDSPGGVGGDYFAARFPETAHIAGLGADGLAQPAALPLIEGHRDTDQGTYAVTPRVPYYPNAKALAGLLIPYPFGGGYASPTETEFYRHSLHFYGEATGDTAPSIVVGGVPGSLPFGELLGDTEVAPNQFHIGGMVDVYVKPVSEPVTETTLRITRDVIDGEVLFTASDGVIDPASPSVFQSIALRDYLCSLTGVDPATEYGYVGEDADGQHLAVEIVLAPEVTLFPRSFRPVNNYSGGVVTDTTFSGITGALSGVRYRVVRRTSVRVGSPGEVLHQGSSLQTSAGSPLVTWSGSPTLFPPAYAGQTYLIIEDGEGAGEYLVEALTGTGARVDANMPATRVGASFRVVLRRPTDVQRGTTVDVLSCSVGDVVVPRGEVLRCEIAGLAAPDDDTVDNRAVGDYGSLLSDGVAPATMSVAGVDWSDYEIMAGDVFEVTPLTGSTTYALTVGSALGDTITFVEVLPQVSVRVKFTGGRSGYARLRLYTDGRALVDVRPSTRVTLRGVDGVDYEFKPSPAEKAVVLSPSEANSVNVRSATTTLVGDTLVFEGESLFKYGVRASDKVEILSAAVRTAPFAPGETIVAFGETLALRVGGDALRGTFTRSSPATYDTAALAAEINQVFRGRVSAFVDADGSIAISSADEIAVDVDGTSPNLYTAMRFDLAGALTDSRPSGLVGEYDILSLQYDHVTGDSSIVLGSATTGAGHLYAIRVVREGHQRSLPSEAVESTGLYYSEFRFRTVFPYTGPMEVVPSSVEVNESIVTGWSPRMDMPLYGYSTEEGLRMSVPAVIMKPYGTRGLADAAANPQAVMTLQVIAAPELPEVQRMLTLDPYRAVASNVLARHYWPAYLWGRIRYSGGASPDAVRAAVGDYLVTRYPNLQVNPQSMALALRRAGVTYVDGGLNLGLVYLDGNRRARAAGPEVVLGKSSHLMADLRYVVIERV